MLLISSSVRKPLSRAKSTVCVPFKTETGGFTPSETVMPVISTWNDTTLGRGASVPVTNTAPDCCCETEGVVDPPPQPIKHAASAQKSIPLNHFLGFMILLPSLLFSIYRHRGVPSRPHPRGVRTPSGWLSFGASADFS